MDLLWGETQFSFGKVKLTTMFCAVQWRSLASLSSHTYCVTILHTLCNEKVTVTLSYINHSLLWERISHCLNVYRLGKAYPATPDSEEKSDPYMLYVVLIHLDLRFA